MSHTEAKPKQTDPFDPDSYSIETLEDEIRADQTCKELLKLFHQYLLKNKNISPSEAGTHASGADYFLRDFILDNRRTSPFKLSVDLIHRFAGNWYIITTLEPNVAELKNILDGVSYFADFCVANKMLDQALAKKIAQTCSNMEFYQQRIDSFNDLSGDQFIAWNHDCPLQ